MTAHKIPKNYIVFKSDFFAKVLTVMCTSIII